MIYDDFKFRESTDLNKCYHITIGDNLQTKNPYPPNTFLPQKIGGNVNLNDLFIQNTKSVKDDFTGEMTADVIEGLIYLLIQKNIIKDVQEFKEIVEAIKVMKAIDKSNEKDKQNGMIK